MKIVPSVSKRGITVEVVYELKVLVEEAIKLYQSEHPGVQPTVNVEFDENLAFHILVQPE